MSRAYYAAFYAVSAHFALEGRYFKSHRGLAVAVSQQLVKEGVWSQELGKVFGLLMEGRYTADYGGIEHVTEQRASEAIHDAEHILSAVQELHPETFSLDEDPE